eukprot:10711365-Ditylum_brightwellii.AAC.1
MVNGKVEYGGTIKSVANCTGVVEYLELPTLITIDRIVQGRRDKVAQEEDESVQYTCPNLALLRIATAGPHNVITLQDTKISTKDVTSSEEKISQLHASPSPFTFHPAISNSCIAPSPVPHHLGDRQPVLPGPSGVLSPVLETDALYKQAGWMIPKGGAAVFSSFSVSIKECKAARESSLKMRK